MTFGTQRPLVILFSALSILAACKKDKDSNETPAAPVIYYSVKATEGTTSDSYQLVSLDAASLTESVVYNLKDSEMRYIAYLPTTKEIVGIADDGYGLIKINPATKQKTFFELSKELNITYSGLVIDKANNLYSLKKDNYLHQYTLVKIDAATGAVTALKPWNDVNYLCYAQSTNEVLGMTSPYRQLAKYNLTSQDTSSVNLTTNAQIAYYSLFTDNKTGLYAFKSTNNSTAELVKFDLATLAESTVTALSEYRALRDTRITFIPQRNEIVSIWSDLSLYRYDLGQKTTTITALSTDTRVLYEGIITN